MRFRSLSARFVLTLLLSTALPFLVFGFVVRSGMRERLESQVVRVLLQDKAADLVGQLGQLIGQVYRDAALIERAARHLLSDGDVTGFDDQLELVVDFHRDFQVVLVADAHGAVQTVVDAVGMLDSSARDSRAALAPESVGDLDWFQAAIQADRSLVWMDRHLSELLHRNPERFTRDPNDYSFGLALRVTGDAGQIGVVYVLVPWTRVQSLVDDVAADLRDAGYPGAVVSVCDHVAQVLSSSDRERYSGRIAQPALEEVVRGIDRKARLCRYEVDGQGEYLAGIDRVAPGIARGLDWRVSVEAPARELFSTTVAFYTAILGVTAFVVGVLVVWSLIASRAILRPVRELARATRELAEGDTSVQVNVRGSDELAGLAASFNRMARQLEQSREQLRTTAREAAWAEMARQIAHEIKNPLTPMRMSAQLVQRARRESDPRLAELTDRLARTVVEQTDQLARIASDFRQFAGKPQPELADVTVDELCDDLAGLFAAEQHDGGPALTFERTAGAARLRVDRGELRRALLNLVQNAQEAAGRSGHVQVRTAVAEDGGVELSVIDDGPDIPPEHRARLFEPYFTTRSAGTGLGLAISRRIVEAHGGRIRLVAADPGRTEFRIHLPPVPTG